MFSWILLSVSAVVFQEILGEKCVKVPSVDFKLCDATMRSNLTKRVCRQDLPMCSRGFNISFLRREPFSSKGFRKWIEETIEYCCGSCGNNQVVNNFTSLRDITPDAINTSHIVYPILGNVEAGMLYGYHFIPVWYLQDAFYITKKRSKAMKLQLMFKAISELWPLIVSMLLMALVAGFLIWIVDTWVNQEMFPRQFPIGLFEGFWWSFITMTTVGYGDKAPQFFISKIFAVVWVLIGITIYALFTASLTNEIDAVVTPEIPDMMGKPVGVIRERLYDVSIVINHGGIVDESQNFDILPAVTEMIDKLENNTNNGFILDQFSYNHVVAYFQVRKELSKYKDFMSKKAFLSKKSNTNLKLSYGMLVKTPEDHEFLQSFASDSQIVTEACAKLVLYRLYKEHYKDSENKTLNIFSLESGLFEWVMIIVGSLVGFIICFGIVYEILRIRLKRFQSCTENMIENFKDKSSK